MAKTLTMASICFSTARLSLIFLPASSAAGGRVEGEEAEGSASRPSAIAPTRRRSSSLADLK